MVGRASKFRCRRSTSRIDTFSKMESQRTGSITKRYRCTEAILWRTDPVHISLSSSSYRRCLCCAHGVAALPCISSNLFAQTSQLAADINLSSASEEPVCLRSNVNDNDDDNAQPVPQDEEEEETEEEDENKTREEKEEEEETLKETKKRQAWNSHERTTTSNSWIDEENNRRSRAWRKTIFASEVRFERDQCEPKRRNKARAPPTCSSSSSLLLLLLALLLLHRCLLDSYHPLFFSLSSVSFLLLHVDEENGVPSFR